jgi:hypothetical protein
MHLEMSFIERVDDEADKVIEGTVLLDLVRVACYIGHRVYKVCI